MHYHHLFSFLRRFTGGFVLLATLAFFTCTVHAQTYAAKEAIADDCYAGNAAGHAIFLPGISPNNPGNVGQHDGFTFVFQPLGTFAEDTTNGTARLTGHVESTRVTGYGWDIDVSFSSRQTAGSNIFELKPPCYAPQGTVDPNTWYHYLTFTGILNGTGHFAGARVMVQQTMHDFQVGKNSQSGASGKNVDPGASGWFTWTVLQQPTDPAFPLRSSSQINSMWFGDFNFNLLTPGINLVKKVDKTNISPGGKVTYTYTVTNTGTVPLTGVTVVDDNGTPNNPNDDTTFGPIDLGPGESHDFTQMRNVQPVQSDQSLCCMVKNQNLNVGTLTTTVLPSGDIQVTYLQNGTIENDNRYGTGANTATGWPSGHKFNDLVGSDHAEFAFTNGAGGVVLDFKVDYISQSSSFPSGYGSLGISGGEGKLVSGDPANVLSATTSLSENLKLPQFQTGFLVNSPPETAPNSGISTPAGWDYNNSYTVVVSKNAFGQSGFGGVQIVTFHNSPPKAGGTNSCTPTPCDEGCVTNIAIATGHNVTGTLTSRASATVCFGTPPGSGCPAKFYKDHESSIGFGYTKDTVLNSVFSNASKSVCSGYGDDGTKKFHDALGWTGGNNLKDAFHGLMREAVTAVLNASNPKIDFGITKADVIAMVNDALKICDAATLTSLANDLEAANTRGSSACQVSSTGNCTTSGKPTQLTLTYTNGDCSTAVNSQPIGRKYNCTDIGGGPNGASPVRIIVSSSSTTPTGTSQRFFDGTVNVNSQFTVNGAFGANTYFFIYSANTLVEMIQMHTSCSAPLIRTETFGALRLDDYAIVRLR